MKKKMNEMLGELIDKIRYEQYLFFQFLIWVSIPVLIMIGILYFVYVSGEKEKNDILLDAYAVQVEENFSSYFTNAREYYIDIINSNLYKSLLKEQSVPWDRIEELVQLQKQLNGERISDMVSSYYFVNVQYEWILGSYGMYSFSQIKNEAELQEFLERIQSQPENIQWVDNQQEESQEDPRKYGMIHLDGRYLVLKSGNLAEELEGVLIIELKLGQLEKIAQSYSKLGYEVLVEQGEQLLLGEEPKAYTQVRRQRDAANSLEYVIFYNAVWNQRQARTMMVWALLFLLGYVLLLFLLKKVTNKISEPFWILKMDNEAQRRKISEFLTINILKGIWDENMIQHYLQQYGWRSEKGYRLLFVKVKGEFEWIESGLPAEIEQNVFLLPVKYKGYLAMLIGDEDETKTEYRTALVYRMLAQYYENQGKFIEAGVSGYFSKLETGNIAVEQCLESISLRAGGREDSVLVVYDDFWLQEGKGKEEAEKKAGLYEAIEQAQKERAVEILHEILSAPQLDNLWGIERQIWVYGLAMGIITAAEKAGVEIGEVFQEDRAELTVFREQIYDRKKLEETIKEEILYPVMEILSVVETSKNEDLVKRVEKLVHEKEGYITLTECAELLHVNSSYLSRVIKKEKEKGFLDIVNEEKARKACRMLKYSSASIAEIGEMLGYNNTQNFIRFFKGQMEITPAKYRKEAQYEKKNL